MTDIRARAGTEDRRVRRTRQALRDALLALIPERGYEAVSVGDITERANVGRSTFYAHFDDKEALLLWSFQELHLMDGPPGADAPALFVVARQMLGQAELNPQLFRAVFGRFGSAAVAARMEQDASAWIAHELSSVSTAGGNAPAMAARVAVSGFLGLLRWWLDTDMQPSAATVADTMEAVLLPGLIATLGVDRRVLTGS